MCVFVYLLVCSVPVGLMETRWFWTPPSLTSGQSKHQTKTFIWDTTITIRPECLYDNRPDILPVTVAWLSSIVLYRTNLQSKYQIHKRIHIKFSTPFKYIYLKQTREPAA